MLKVLTLAVILFVVMASPTITMAKQVTVAASAWEIIADDSAGQLTISYKDLGVILNRARLSVANGGKLIALRRWTADKTGNAELAIKTIDPKSAWVFRIYDNEVRISSSSDDASIIAQGPASAQRIVARLQDRQGFPVDWVGTGEVAVSYGGRYTHNQSFLPRRNPEVASFALGQVSSANLHSLFDRPTDIAIDFPEGSTMVRTVGNADLLNITIPIRSNGLIRLTPDYFTKTLGVPFYVPFDDSQFKSAPMVWSSWTSYYERVKESDITLNADWISAHLKPYGFQYVQLDDGYDRGANNEHYWIEKWDQQKFPHGPKWLGDYIKSKGLRAGIWLVPNSYAGAVEQHPDWYLHYKSGKILLDYNTPALDSSNPQVLDFLRKEMTTLDKWGFDYYKFDGEHALPKYIPGVDLDKLYDKTTDPVTVYRNRLKVIRDTIGPDRFIEGDIAGTPLNGIGYINSFFNGHDLYDNWQGMYSLFSSINGNVFFNHLLAYTMPGEGIAIEPRMSFEEAQTKRNESVIGTEREREFPLTGFGTTLPEARTVVSYIALTGVAYSVASVMPELPNERVNLLHMTMPTMPIFPIDLFSRGSDMEWDKFKHTTADDYIHNYPEILDLKVDAAAGTYDVVALTNWGGTTETRDLSFADKLGLDGKSSYVAFDFWNQKIYGVLEGQMNVQIAPHDTRVFQLHPLLGRPQLVGTSRHISGAYSILNLTWDESKQMLRGSSQTVPGDPYSLWIYVPANEAVWQVNAAACGKNISTVHSLTGYSLQINFQGQQDPVEWEVMFRTQR